MTETIHRAYVYALDPTPTQEAALRSHCGGARFAYNHMLALVKAQMDQRAAERSYGIPDEQLTESIGWSFYSLRKEWNARKDATAPWWSENSKEAYANGIKGLANALKNWNDSRKGKRKGKASGFPSFHGKKLTKTCTFTTGTLRLEPSRHHVTLPKLGTIHTMESTRRLARRIESGSARILRATVSYRRGRWQVSLLAEVNAADRPARGGVVGVDVGVKDWIVAATSDGTEVLRVPVPAQLTELDARKRALQRRNRNRQAPRKGVKPSNRWRAAQRRIDILDWKLAAVREDALHKATTELAARFDTVVIEDLNVKGMMTRGGSRKRGLNRAIARSGLAMSRTMIGYKSQETVMVNRWFPSSKTCSSCGAVKAKLSLGERTYVCDHTACGHTMDRDLNAAVNLAKHGEVILAGSPPVSGRGAERKTEEPAGISAAGNEASTVTPIVGDGGVRGNADVQLVAI